MKTKCCHTRHIHVVERQKICVNPKCQNYLGPTPCYREQKLLRNGLAVSLFTFSMLFSFDDFSNSKPIPIRPEALTIQNSKAPLTIGNLRSEILRLNIVCHEEVLAQIKLEPGNLSSGLLRKTNNLLGMRYPYKRRTTATGLYIPALDTIIKGNSSSLRKFAKHDQYAVYDNWQNAVADYKLWQESNFNMSEKYLITGKNLCRRYPVH